MADSNLTSGERLEIYQTIFLINRSFHNIVKRLEDLDRDSVFDSEELAQYRGLTQELQADINSHFLNRLHSVEEKDWAFFGKVRIGRENGSEIKSLHNKTARLRWRAALLNTNSISLEASISPILRHHAALY